MPRDVPSVPQEIIDAAKKGKLVLFIGAGVLRIIGGPSWYELAVKLLDDLWKDKKAINYYEYQHLKLLDAKKLLSICTKIYKKRGITQPRLKDLLLRNLSLDRDNPVSNIYKNLSRFNAIYVTTNYEELLCKELTNAQQRQKSVKEPASVSPSSAEEEKVSKGDGEGPQICYFLSEELLVSNLKEGRVLHLHGSVKNENRVIITVSQYLGHYRPDTEPTVLLEEIFTKYTVLFIGYGLEEYEILDFIVNKSKSASATGEIKHYMLYPMFTHENKMLEFLKGYYEALGIELIPYSIDEKGYEQLAYVIEKWAKVIGSIPRPPEFFKGKELIDEVVK